MADPQATTPAEQARARGNAAPHAPAAEPRAFGDQAGLDPAHLKGTQPADAAHAPPATQAARRMAESGHYAGRQMADAWRQTFDPLLSMQYDLGRLFDDMFRQTFGFRGPAPLRPFGHFTPASFFGLPPADLKETETAHLLAVELPGLSRDDVELSIEGDALVVSGHRAEETQDASAAYRVSERRYGRFERAFPLPPDIDRGRIEAQFKDGLLKITLPKNPALAEPRSKIEIRG